MSIVGTGGISEGRDAIEIMMAGATLVGVGTAVWLRGQDVFLAKLWRKCVSGVRLMG